MRLLSGRVYRLRNGTRFVARQTPQNNRFDLLTTNDLAWSPADSPYKAEPDGTISYMGKPTVWRSSDLVDTGQEMPSLAAGA